MKGFLNARLVAAAQLLSLLAVMWMVEVIDQTVFNEGLDKLGIQPREPFGLLGIVFAPFLHGGYEHLSNNTSLYLIFGALLVLVEAQKVLWIFASSALGGGLLVWLVGAGNSVHIGASGVLYGMLGYLLTYGFFNRTTVSVLVSVGVAAMFGTVLLGVLPGEEGVSWISHLFGLLAGGGFAYVSAKGIRELPGRGPGV